MFQFFFFNDTATTEIYTLSLHDALPISLRREERPSFYHSAGVHQRRRSNRHHRVEGRLPDKSRLVPQSEGPSNYDDRNRQGKIPGQGYYYQRPRAPAPVRCPGKIDARLQRISEEHHPPDPGDRSGTHVGRSSGRRIRSAEQLGQESIDSSIDCQPAVRTLHLDILRVALASCWADMGGRPRHKSTRSRLKVVWFLRRK